MYAKTRQAVTIGCSTNTQPPDFPERFKPFDEGNVQTGSVLLSEDQLELRASEMMATGLPLAHSGAETHGHFDLFRCKLEWEVGARHMCCMEARTFHSTAAQVESAQIGLAKVAVRKIDVDDVHAAQIDAAKVATAKVALLAGLVASIEFLDAAFAQ